MHCVIFRVDVAQFLLQQRTGTKPFGSPSIWRAHERRMNGFSLRQAERERRIGGTQERVLGARYTAFSKIPGNGVQRVRRRRFAEVRSDSIIGGSIIGGSIIGGSGNGVSSIRLASIAALPVSFSMLSIWAVTGVSSSMHESSMLGNSSRRRSLLVDVELELGISTGFWADSVVHMRSAAGRRGAHFGGAAKSSERGNEPTTCEASTAVKGNCGFTKPVTALCSWIWGLGTCTICFAVCCCTRSCATHHAVQRHQCTQTVAPAPADTYAAPAPMIECVAPAIPEPVNTYVAPALVIEYIAPSPAVSYPSFYPSFRKPNEAITGLVNPQISITADETSQVQVVVQEIPEIPVVEWIQEQRAVPDLVNPQISATSVEASQVVGSFPLLEDFAARMYNQVHQEQIVATVQQQAIVQEIPEVQVVERIQEQTISSWRKKHRRRLSRLRRAEPVATLSRSPLDMATAKVLRTSGDERQQTVPQLASLAIECCKEVWLVFQTFVFSRSNFEQMRSNEWSPRSPEMILAA